MELEIENYIALHGNEHGYTSKLLEDLYFLVEHGKFHYALNVYHLLFMTFVYQTLLKAREWRKIKFRNSLIHIPSRETRREDLLESSSAFIFSKIKERTAFNYLEIFDAKGDLIRNCKALVDKRNERSHANGIYDDGDLFENTISAYNESAFQIHKNTKKFLIGIFEKFIKGITRGEVLTKDDLEIYLIEPNHLNKTDLICLSVVCASSGRRIQREIKEILVNEYDCQQ